jgi:pimeloyl-ACP methyl ester carboxylesterase
VPVAFTVQNVNGSLLPCAADGKRYVLRGHLVGPRKQLRRPRVGVVTVYVHDFTTGGWFWRFPDRRYDHVGNLARAGHVSLVLDRLGYDDRHDVEGTATCLGAQADMLHQVVQRIRTGDYRSTSVRPRARDVVVAGHAVGAAIAELEAASFDDVDGLVLMSWSDSGPSLRAVQEAAVQTQACLAGGDPRVERPGYAYFGQSRRDFRELLFHSATPVVQRRAAALRNPDPCGDALTLGPMVAENNLLSRSVDVPVLLLFGAEDVLNRPEAAELQQHGYRPGSDVTAQVLPGTGSALPLEQTAPRTRRLVSSWTCQRFDC